MYLELSTLIFCSNGSLSCVLLMICYTVLQHYYTSPVEYFDTDFLHVHSSDL
jgi:hypothetical protein